MIARIKVEHDGLTEYPIAEMVKGGWQNGIRFYPDEKVTEILGTYHPNLADVTEEEIAASMLAVPQDNFQIGLTPHGLGKALAAASAFRHQQAWAEGDWLLEPADESVVGDD